MSVINYTWKEIKTCGDKLDNLVPCTRSSHDISIINNILYVFGGEHIARTPIDSNLYYLDLSNLTNDCEWKIAEYTG